MAPAPASVLILDNGASSIKAGFAHSEREPFIVPNSIARSKVERRTFVGDEISDSKDFSAITSRSPFDRGYLVGWETEKPIWDRLFSASSGLKVEPPSTALVLTESYFNLPSLQETYDQMIFEEWDFESCYRTTPASLVAASPSVLFPPTHLSGSVAYPECSILVDAGYSYTHVVTVFNGRVVESAIKRIDVGGKLLTNHFKTLLSFRHWNMMDQTHVVNQVKEQTCFVSDNFTRDLLTCQCVPSISFRGCRSPPSRSSLASAPRKFPRSSPIYQRYLLPDFASPATMQGYVLPSSDAHAAKPPHEEDESQILPLENERFTVPELLFQPSLIGMEQTGLPETIARSIALLPPETQGLFWANIGVYGGSTAYKGFSSRLQTDLRAFCPSEYSTNVYTSSTPTLAPFLAARSLFSDSSPSTSWSPARAALERERTTRLEYFDVGAEGLRARRKEWALEKESGLREEGIGSLADMEAAARKAKPLPPPPPPPPLPLASTAVPAAVPVPGASKSKGKGKAGASKIKTEPGSGAGVPAKTGAAASDGAPKPAAKTSSAKRKKGVPGPGRGWRLGKGKVPGKSKAESTGAGASPSLSSVAGRGLETEERAEFTGGDHDDGSKPMETDEAGDE